MKMDPQSPPKRMTRARAAAKASETGSSSTSRTTTAASRAKAKAAVAPTAPVSNKRKTRSDDNEVEPQTKGRQRQQSREEEHSEAPQKPEPATRVTRATRLRPRTNPESSSSSSSTAKTTTTTSTKTTTTSGPARATRARAATRTTATEAPQPPKPVTRSRPKRNPVLQDGPQPTTTEPLRKTTRSRTAVSAATSAATMPATTTRVKKKVTFDAPEKENVDPDAAKKAPTATGLRARPVRKPPVPRVARGTTKAGPTSNSAPSKEAKAPLSPKKVTQVPYSRDDSEDELTAVEKSGPVRSMVKDPLKPPASALSSFRKPNLRREQPEPASSEEPRSVEETEGDDGDEPPSRDALASPARRPPTSPPKDSIRSPAKRAEGLTLPKPSSASAANPTADGHATPFKTSLLNTPARRPQSAIKVFSLNLPSASRNNVAEETMSAQKVSLLKSPAKRPHVPILARPSPTPEEPAEESVPAPVVAQPSVETLETSPTLESPSDKPSVMTSSEKLMIEEHDDEAMDQLADKLELQLPLTLQFPGRLSAVLPRHADPALRDRPAILHEQLVDQPQTPHQDPSSVDDLDPMMVDEADLPSNTTADPAPAAVPSHSPPKGAFGLRERDMDPYHDLDSEPENDDTTCNLQINHLAAATPAARTSRPSLAPPHMSAAGFTPLAQQLGAWSASSPTKTAAPSVPRAAGIESLSHAVPSPMKSTFFEDEMTVRAESEVHESLTAEADGPDEDFMDDGDVEDPEFDDIMVTEEDIDLAAEADQMSLLEPEQPYQATTRSFDDSLSDASQEYGDENEMPVDPALARASPRPALAVPPKTPMRTLRREFHTVSKVPLKPADESTPRPKRRRAASISRLPVSRPTQGLARSATVISYTPTKKDKMDNGQGEPGSGRRGTSTPVTPTKSGSALSVMETPGRTPRPDLNPSLLGGAVVFVDVYTSEGADASCVFVDLLSQMGARCVKDWAWNPDGADGSDKVGITHVVYKDGSKRTLEKVREARGVVQCVGVTWVLDCERENKWLDEEPYSIDTSLTPRRGGRRRQTMEPKALAKLNGMLASSSPANGRRRHTQTAPNTPMNRRDSTEWMVTPCDRTGDGDGDDDDDWQAMLTPVPVTPAPDALARYAAELTPGTPTTAFDFYDSPSKTDLLRTCPPKTSAYREMGRGILDREKDESVVLRLMAARRKSLQFAPKISSPLARAW
ncbi:hypothetical protein ACRALDRAFT_1077127 [Sodiomyces alcalophilus JCM 7366]|uniref:uncharacterized protein n=1 Tax=Sodiomyces alcalophilus JCM 7366 TaxID=591952 RepID=UPI0039B3CD2F